MYEIIVKGDRAEADDLAGALLAAATLTDDQAVGYGTARRIREEVVITRDGTYDGAATTAARRGDR